MKYENYVYTICWINQGFDWCLVKLI